MVLQYHARYCNTIWTRADFFFTVELSGFLPKQDTSSLFTVLKSSSAEIIHTWHK
jgi:hypothetical protein